jgi:hypothetical protein
VELDLQGSGKGQERTQASLLIFVRPGESWEPETWALKEKKAFFEKQFQLKLNFEVRVETRPQISRGSYLPD